MTNQNDDYPPYVIFFDGELVEGAPKKVEGPHTFELLKPQQDMAIRVELTHNDTDEIPNLTITLTQQKPKP